MAHQGQDSEIDIGAIDIDNLFDEDDYIPSKDSTPDGDGPTDTQITSNVEMQKVDTVSTQIPNDTNTQIPSQDSIHNYNIDDINAFGDEEKGNPISRIDSDMHMTDVTLTTEIQHQLDIYVMTLLHPDVFKEPDLVARRENLKQQFAVLQDWKNKQIDSEIVNVADAMSKIESVSMYDQDWQTNEKKDDEKTKDSYVLVEEDLSALEMVPDSFWKNANDKEEIDVRPTAAKSFGSGTAEYLRKGTTENFDNTATAAVTAVSLKFNVLGGMALGMANKSDAIVCGACGVQLKFKASKRHKYHYIGYVCKRTGREWIFHDYLCVKLRKIKEAIKDYVYMYEKDRNINVEDENALINIETNPTQRKNKMLRPAKKTTPKKGDHNYNITMGDQDGSEEKEESMSSRYNSMESFYSMESELGEREMEKQKSKSKKDKAKKREKGIGYLVADDVEVPQYLDMRRYRSNVKRILDRLSVDKRNVKGLCYSERFGDLPEILLYCDLNEFGVAIFEFVSDDLKSKMRDSLWDILVWLALEMSTNEILDLLQRHTHLLSKHELYNYDRVCKAAMEGSKFPIACTLRLSAFMYERSQVDLSNREAFKQKGEQYVNVSRKLLKEIESDHLFALLLMIPTDIRHQNVIEIALKYDLTYFLEEPRIVRVFSVIWFNGYDFLNPEKNFSEPAISVDEVFDKILKDPGLFFFSPFGKFWISSILYLGYLGLFSYVTYQRIYDYPSETSVLEIALWVSCVAYVVYESLEFWGGPKEYFDTMTNYWDIIISINWIILFYIRFIYDTPLIYGDDGILDEQSQRNTMSTEVFMAFWALQSVILWTRVASLFKISERAGPLIRMIMNMLGDIMNFFLIWGLFFMGGAFAAYFIIGGDLMQFEDVSLGTFSSVMFYIFKTLIGQQDWDKTSARIDSENTEVDAFDTMRSNMLQTVLVFYSIFGQILLLNLLIAMMASSYETVKDRSLQEVNKQKIDTIYDLDKSRSVITPPFNVLAYIFYVYWFAFEIITWALTFGHRQFNEEWFSPLNHELDQYSVGDIITFQSGKKSGEVLTGECIKKTPKAERSTKKHFGRASMMTGGADMTDQMSHLEDADLVVLIRDKEIGQYKPAGVKDSQIETVKKRFFKRRKLRIPSLNVESEYCPFCRYNLTHDRMSIDHYLSLFELSGQHIDPDDKFYIQALIQHKDGNGIPQPITCNLCPNCYRPFKVTMGGKEVLGRMMFILEIVSYIVFWLTLRWVILLIIFIPACVVKIVKFIIKKFTETVSGKSQSQKSIMNTSEENDDYRAKVRQVSKSEEKIDAVMRRIDTSVNRLESTLLGDKSGFNDDDLDDDIEEDIHNLRSDEFDEEIRKMKKDLDKKFKQIRELLSKYDGGYQE